MATPDEKMKEKGFELSLEATRFVSYVRKKPEPDVMHDYVMIPFNAGHYGEITCYRKMEDKTLHEYKLPEDIIDILRGKIAEKDEKIKLMPSVKPPFERSVTIEVV